MIICFDVGNTDIDTGVFDNDVLVKTFNIPYKKDWRIPDYTYAVRDAFEENGIALRDVKGCMICSVVVSTTENLSRAVTTVFGYEPVLFKNDENCGIEIKTDNPHEVGTDIVVGCMAVKEKHTVPAIVIDMGTATTITAMDSTGAIIGVSILLGVLTSLKALHNATGLPIDLSLTAPEKVIGTNTADSIAGGIVYGSAAMMDGMTDAFEKEIGEKCEVYATGRLAKIILPLCRREYHIDNTLLLEGMYMYYKNYMKNSFDL